MRVDLATDGGHPGRSNEDFVGAVPGGVVLLDGAGIAGAEAICAHGVAWYTRRLGGLLLAALAGGSDVDLATILGTAIGDVAASHRETCDLADPTSPQATVAMARVGDDRVDYLVLADTYAVIHAADGDPDVITDEREAVARQICAAPLAGVATGSAEYVRVFDACAQEFRARRNQPGGYWIAKDDPRAAGEAVTGSRPLNLVTGVGLLSNGAARIVCPYDRADWPGVVASLHRSGAAALVAMIRQAEGSPGVDVEWPPPDDVTVAYCTELSPD
jgi:hypothetical protein